MSSYEYVFFMYVLCMCCLALRLTSPVRSASVRREGTVWLGRSAKIDMASCTKACTYRRDKTRQDKRERSGREGRADNAIIQRGLGDE